MLKLYATSVSDFPDLGTNNQPIERQKQILTALGQQPEKVNVKLNSMVLDYLTQVHCPQFVNFITNAFNSLNGQIPHDHCVRADDQIYLVPQNIRRSKHPEFLPVWKQIVHYSTDRITPIAPNTHSHALVAIRDVIQAGFDFLNDPTRLCYVIPCSPGHHAGYDFYGGFCYFNNSCVLAKLLLSKYQKVGILDLDYHCGDGIGDILQRQDSMKGVSLHINPKYDYPYYTGFAEDSTPNMLYVPFEPKCTIEKYLDHMDTAQQFLQDCDVIIVSFGADTYALDPENNPAVRPQIQISDYEKIGLCLKNKFLQPKIFIQEGGYALDVIGEIVQHLFRPFTGK